VGTLHLGLVAQVAAPQLVGRHNSPAAGSIRPSEDPVLLPAEGSCWQVAVPPCYHTDSTDLPVADGYLVLYRGDLELCCHDGQEVPSDHNGLQEAAVHHNDQKAEGNKARYVDHTLAKAGAARRSRSWVVVGTT